MNFAQVRTLPPQWDTLVRSRQMEAPGSNRYHVEEEDLYLDDEGRPVTADPSWGGHRACIAESCPRPPSRRQHRRRAVYVRITVHPTAADMARHGTKQMPAADWYKTVQCPFITNPRGWSTERAWLKEPLNLRQFFDRLAECDVDASISQKNKGSPFLYTRQRATTRNDNDIDYYPDLSSPTGEESSASSASSANNNTGTTEGSGSNKNTGLAELNEDD